MWGHNYGIVVNKYVVASLEKPAQREKERV